MTNTTHKVGGVDYFFLSGKKTLNCPFTSAVPSGKYAIELHRNTVWSENICSRLEHIFPRTLLRALYTYQMFSTESVTCLRILELTSVTPLSWMVPISAESLPTFLTPPPADLINLRILCIDRLKSGCMDTGAFCFSRDSLQFPKIRDAFQQVTPGEPRVPAHICWDATCLTMADRVLHQWPEVL